MKERAGRNRTMTLSGAEIARLRKRLVKIESKVSARAVIDKTICQDLFAALKHLPEKFVDLVLVDPPYNLNKTFNSSSFQEVGSDEYAAWLDKWIPGVIRTLKPTASLYVCGDWKSSGALHAVLKKYLKIRNRITFERDKGRGAKSNWKNCSEDIWFCTLSDEYIFNVDAVMMKRKVIAPYKNQDGQPKDWEETNDGKYRVTHPSNIWTDITIPFWSMPENTDHPTQKPEKLAAKIILASSNPNDVVFDPFLGSGTTSVVAKKLGRRYVGIDMDELYCCLAEKRLELASTDKTIQGYSDGVFWERNTLNIQNSQSKKLTFDPAGDLFEAKVLLS